MTDNFLDSPNEADPSAPHKILNNSEQARFNLVLDIAGNAINTGFELDASRRASHETNCYIFHEALTLADVSLPEAIASAGTLPPLAEIQVEYGRNQDMPRTELTLRLVFALVDSESKKIGKKTTVSLTRRVDQSCETAFETTKLDEDSKDDSILLTPTQPSEVAQLIKDLSSIELPIEILDSFDLQGLENSLVLMDRLDRATEDQVRVRHYDLTDEENESQIGYVEIIDDGNTPHAIEIAQQITEFNPMITPEGDLSDEGEDFVATIDLSGGISIEFFDSPHGGPSRQKKHVTVDDLQKLFAFIEQINYKIPDTVIDSYNDDPHQDERRDDT